MINVFYQTLVLLYTEKYKKVIKNNEFKVSAPTWNEELELPDGSYSVWDIQDSFEFIFKKKHERDNLSVIIFVHKIENRITFKIKTGYYLELLTTESMELLGSSKSKISKNENGKNVPQLEIDEVILVHCNIFNNNYQQDMPVLYKFVPNKSFVQLLDISPKNFIFLKAFNSEFSFIEVLFTNQNSKC